jgi:6-phosphogluconolactonase
VLQHTGSSVDPARQKGPHAHSFRPSPDNRFALACDLGTDRVYVYAIDPEHGTFTPHGEAALPPGYGPRHLAFHPNGNWVFVNYEMLMTVITFAYDAAQGVLQRQVTVSTLPEADRDKKGFSSAEVVVHPNGKFVYVSNRAHDTIAILACDPSTGKLTLLENVPAEGKVPRNFALDLTGNWLLVAHQDSDSVAVFTVDPQTGRLQFTGQKVEVGKPCCVRFLAVQ